MTEVTHTPTQEQQFREYFESLRIGEFKDRYELSRALGIPPDGISSIASKLRSEGSLIGREENPKLKQGEYQKPRPDRRPKPEKSIFTSMTLPEISKINRARAERWHAGGGEWTASDWGNALGGENGELCLAGLEYLVKLSSKAGALQNTIKKVRRHETHVDRIATGRSYNTPELSVLRARLKDEVADVFLYLDLVSYYFGLELEECIFPKFNQVSETQGFPERLGE